jgi:hypothetical protein
VRPDGSPAGASWKSSKKKREDVHLRKHHSSQTLHKQKDIYNKCKSPLTSSQAKYNYKFTIAKEAKITKKD